MIHVHDLAGCAPAPLAHYLKALGILRLVSVQVDANARGWWEGERFRLATLLNESDIETFFLNHYQPTPFVAPWNGGTGFYPKDKKAKQAINGIVNHGSDRFTPYRNAIEEALTVVGSRTEAPDKKGKERFLQACLRDWRGLHREAMASAVVLNSDGKPGYPSLLGTGFNDGRLDFTSNFMGRLLQLFPSADGAQPSETRELLRETLFKEASLGMDTKGAIGQFLPGNAGGANSASGPVGDPISNPWDFVLMLEGTLLFTAHATRRLGSTQSSKAAAPFSVSAQGAGYASAADSDESARGEQWMPLWSQPMTLRELRHLFAESRAQIGAKPVKEPLDLARAVARLGTARGIQSFQRYGYIERNGQANFAVPIGRFSVPARVSPSIACLDDLDPWHGRLRLEARDEHAPARLKHAERCLADALFAVTQHPDESSRWQTVLLALGEVEVIHIQGGNLRCGPIPKLRAEWVEAVSLERVEMRLALVCARQAAGFHREHGPVDRIRRHWLPAKNGETAAVMQGRSGVNDAIALVERRLIEAAQHGARRLPLQAAFRSDAHPADLADWLAGSVDTDRTLALARALMALDRQAVLPSPPGRGGGGEGAAHALPDDAWMVLRLSLLPWPLVDGREVKADPAIFRRLSSGDAAGAVELALRRLSAAGIRTAVRAAALSPETARLWAAALAFPISRNTAKEFVRYLDPNQETQS